MNTTELSILCPFCKTELEAATYVGPDEASPGKDDVTLCFSCGEFAVFDDDPLQLRKPTEEEYAEIGINPELRQVRETWIRVRAEMAAARDKPQEPAPKIGVLDTLFQPVATKVAERGVDDDLILRMKTVFALGCKATLHTMSYDDEALAQEMIDRLATELDEFFRNHPALVRQYMKGAKL